MNLPPTGSSTLLSKLESRELRRPCTSACHDWWHVIMWFALMRRYDTGINVHITSVVPLLHGRARSQSFITDENKSPHMNLLYAFSEYFDFQILVSPISLYTGLVILVSEHICSFWYISRVSDIYCIHCAETSAYARNQENRFQTWILNA